MAFYWVYNLFAIKQTDIVRTPNIEYTPPALLIVWNKINLKTGTAKWPLLSFNLNYQIHEENPKEMKI